MNQFIYDGSHWGKEDNECVMELANGISVWIHYRNRKEKYEVRFFDDVLIKVDSFEQAQLFLNGMSVFAANKEKTFEKIVRKNYPEDTASLREELDKAHAELERTKRLAEKLIKGIVKNEKEEIGKEIADHLEQVYEKIQTAK